MIKFRIQFSVLFDEEMLPPLKGKLNIIFSSLTSFFKVASNYLPPPFFFGGGGEVIRAMPERKHSFLGGVPKIPRNNDFLRDFVISPVSRYFQCSKVS